MKNKPDNSSYAVAVRFMDHRAKRDLIPPTPGATMLATDAIAFDRSERGRSGGSKSTPAKARAVRRNLNAGRPKRWPKNKSKKIVDTKRASV